MQQKGILAGALMSAGVLLAQPAWAAMHEGGWVQTGEGAAVRVEVSPNATWENFYVYDVDAEDRENADTVKVFDDDDLIEGNTYSAEITIEKVDLLIGEAVCRYQATVSLESGPEQYLRLWDSPAFGFFFSSWGERSYTYALEGPTAGGAFILTPATTDMAINIQGATPTPVPASLVLLGSGLLGILSFGRRARAAG